MSRDSLATTTVARALFDWGLTTSAKEGNTVIVGGLKLPGETDNTAGRYRVTVERIG